MHYLQDEYASLIVQGRFDKATSQTFRALQKNTSGLNAHALQNLKLASAISASSINNGSTKAATGNRDYTGAGSSWRGSYNNRYTYRPGPGRGRGRGYNNNYPRSDVFDQFAQKGV